MMALMLASCARIVVIGTIFIVGDIGELLGEGEVKVYALQGFLGLESILCGKELVFILFSIDFERLLFNSLMRFPLNDCL